MYCRLLVTLYEQLQHLHAPKYKRNYRIKTCASRFDCRLVWPKEWRLSRLYCCGDKKIRGLSFQKFTTLEWWWLSNCWVPQNLYQRLNNFLPALPMQNKCANRGPSKLICEGMWSSSICFYEDVKLQNCCFNISPKNVGTPLRVIMNKQFSASSFLNLSYANKGPNHFLQHKRKGCNCNNYCTNHSHCNLIRERMKISTLIAVGIGRFRDRLSEKFTQLGPSLGVILNE